MAVSRLSHEEHAQRLADYLPGGQLFRAKNVNDSNFRRLLRGIARELFTAEGYLVDFQDNIIPDATYYFIDEWESALGIPDGCFLGTGSIDERRRDILLKLASLGVQTVDDFYALAEIIGVDVEIVPGSVSGVFPLSFPVLVFGTAEDARFTIVVNIGTALSTESIFPLAFPIPFGTKEIGALRCLFARLKPANCNLLIRQVG